MSESLRTFGAFLYCLSCALLGLALEYAGQGALWAGHGLMHVSNRLGDYALQAMPEDSEPFE